MELILNIAAFLIAVLVLILIHECGHFFVARWCGVKVVRFSLGFGKALYEWHDKKGTAYAIALIPLGGYVKMLDSREMEVSAKEKHLAFDTQATWRRMLIILAGPLTNVVFGLLAFWCVFTVGMEQPKPIIGEVALHSVASQAGLQLQDEIVAINNKATKNWQQVALILFSHAGDKVDLPITIKREKNGPTSKEENYNLNLRQWKLDEWQPDPLRDLGITPYMPFVPPVFGEVVKNGPVDKAGLASGDRVISIAGKRFNDWKSMIEFVQTKPSQQLLFVVDRQGQQLSKVVTTSWRLGPRWRKIGYLGVRSLPVVWPPEKTRQEKYTVFNALEPTLQQSYDFIAFNGVVLQKLFSGKLTLRILGGPIAIFQSAAMAIQKGFIVYVGFLGLLSLMLAFINLLPIPALDGGYIIFLLYEAILRKPLSVAVQELILRLGLIFLILLMVQGVFNDLKRLLE